MKQELLNAFQYLERFTSSPRARRSLSRTFLILLFSSFFAGIFLAVVPPINFTKRTPDTTIKAARADVTEISAELENFRVDNGRLPTTAEGLAALYLAPSNFPNWKGPYVGKAVGNDSWGHPYIYICPGIHNPQSFDLSSMGHDGQPGGGDDIDNWTTKTTNLR